MCQPVSRARITLTIAAAVSTFAGCQTPAGPQGSKLGPPAIRRRELAREEVAEASMTEHRLRSASALETARGEIDGDRTVKLDWRPAFSSDFFSVPVNAAQSDEIPDFQISLGALFGGGADATGNLVGIEGEIPFLDNFSVAAQLLRYEYHFEEDDDEFTAEEDGDGIGIGAEARWFPRRSLDGFYIGAGVGVYPFTDWEFTETNTRTGQVVDFEDGDDVAIESHGTLGWMFRIGRHVALTPVFTFGTYITDSPESGPYAGLGLRVSVGF